VAEACTGLAFLHDFKFVHNDFKAENILVFDDGPGTARRAKVTDLGLALGERPICASLCCVVCCIVVCRKRALLGMRENV